jgi:hypothetical protein
MSRRKLTPEGRKGVEEYSAAELHTFLVEDAVKRHATFLPWAVAAYERIGAAPGGKGAEAAYQSVLDDVEGLTGLRRMPVGSPLTPEELARLMQ